MSDKNNIRKTLALLADPRGRKNPAKERAARDFEKAHRRAFMQNLLSLVRYEPVDLLPFEEVREKLNLSNKFYQGIQEIPVAQIVGSVNRYEDFTRTFMPRKTNTRQRWENVNSLIDSGGWPPIEVYKVSDAYFVRDGNHRVSVARQLDMEKIEAHVWEYPTRVPLEADDDLEDLLLRQEYIEFLDDTGLDRLRPEQYIVLTLPGGYWELEESIAVHRHWAKIDRGVDLSWPEAVADWYDTVYLPMANKVREEEILTYFPGRTEGDLVVWTLRHWDTLERDEGWEDAEPDEVVEDFAERARGSWFRRLKAWFERVALGKWVDVEE